MSTDINFQLGTTMSSTEHTRNEHFVRMNTNNVL